MGSQLGGEHLAITSRRLGRAQANCEIQVSRPARMLWRLLPDRGGGTAKRVRDVLAVGLDPDLCEPRPGGA